MRKGPTEIAWNGNGGGEWEFSIITDVFLSFSKRWHGGEITNEEGKENVQTTIKRTTPRLPIYPDFDENEKRGKVEKCVRVRACV